MICQNLLLDEHVKPIMEVKRQEALSAASQINKVNNLMCNIILGINFIVHYNMCVLQSNKKSWFCVTYILELGDPASLLNVHDPYEYSYLNQLH